MCLDFQSIPGRDLFSVRGKPRVKIIGTIPHLSFGRTADPGGGRGGSARGVPPRPPPRGGSGGVPGGVPRGAPGGGFSGGKSPPGGEIPGISGGAGGVKKPPFLGVFGPPGGVPRPPPPGGVPGGVPRGVRERTPRGGCFPQGHVGKQVGFGGGSPPTPPGEGGAAKTRGAPPGAPPGGGAGIFPIFGGRKTPKIAPPPKCAKTSAE